MELHLVYAVLQTGLDSDLFRHPFFNLINSSLISANVTNINIKEQIIAIVEKISRIKIGLGLITNKIKETNINVKNIPNEIELNTIANKLFIILILSFYLASGGDYCLLIVCNF